MNFRDKYNRSVFLSDQEKRIVHESRFEIEDNGKVWDRVLRRSVVAKNGKKCPIMYFNGEKYYISRIVFRKYVSHEIPLKCEVAFLDGNPHNCCASNLQARITSDTCLYSLSEDTVVWLRDYAVFTHNVYSLSEILKIRGGWVVKVLTGEYFDWYGGFCYSEDDLVRIWGSKSGWFDHNVYMPDRICRSY